MAGGRPATKRRKGASRLSRRDPAARESREIPLRELRNSVSKVLAAVSRGRSFRITVAGRPVADLVPASQRRTWVPWAEIERILREAPLDTNFSRDVAFMREQYADER